MAQEIKAHEHPLSVVFSDDYLYEIPDYQRPYAWTTEQVQELFDDVWGEAKKARTVDDVGKLDPYFLGCVVLVKPENDPLSHVVDGQQRLTTLTMLWCALRETFSGETMAQSLDKRVWQEGDEGIGMSAVARLGLRRADKGFFEERVQRSGALAADSRPSSQLTDTQSRIQDNALHLFRQCSNLCEADRRKLVRFLLNRCFLVVVATSDQASANRIFTILHTRGLDLSFTDILKAKIAASADSEHLRRWEDVEESIGRAEFRSLFTHIYTVHAKERNRRPLEDVFVDRVISDRMSGDDFITTVLEPCSEIYRELTSTGFGDLPEAHHYLQSLRRIDNADWIPPAMQFCRKYRNDPTRLLDFVRDLERLAYHMFIAKTYRDHRVERYLKVLEEIDNGLPLDREGSELQLTPSEKLCMLGSLANPVDWKWARAVLLRLDRVFADQGAEYRHSIITVEHVLPQTPRPDSEWIRVFPNESTRIEWTSKLANLVLLSRPKNSAASNREFADKKDTYFNTVRSTAFALTRQVLAEESWTPEVLERRQRDLVAKLAEEWRLD